MTATPIDPAPARWYRHLPVAAALLLVLAVAAGLRMRGVDWDDGQHLHPDERFLTMVALSLEPVASLGDYFDTASSTLNPRNRGSRPHYVYGTFPLILTRSLAAALDAADYRNLHLVGRRLSATADLLVVLLVFLIGVRLGGAGLGLLAAAFSAVAVLQIQLSHFFIVDTFANLFAVAAVWASVVIATRESSPSSKRRQGTVGLLALGLLFGLTAGAAAAAKLNTAPVVVLLPAALGLLWLRQPPAQRRQSLPVLAGCLVAGALASFAAFRILQPYAFAGPGFCSLRPARDWLDTLRLLSAQSGPLADAPPALQWARRPVWFAGQQLLMWGFGPPLGLLALAGFLACGWHLLRGRAQRLLLPWLWTAAYFTWQSLAINPTMRYLLPVYPMLALLAAWAVVSLWRASSRPDRRALALVCGGLVLVATALWACAFSRIYTRPVTRVAASRWLLQHAPGPINLRVDTTEGPRQQPVPVPPGFLLSPSGPLVTQVTTATDGQLRELFLPKVEDVIGEMVPWQNLVLTLYRGTRLVEPLARLTAAPADPPTHSCRFVLADPFEVQQGERLTIALALQSATGTLRLTGAAIANESSWDDGLPLRVDGHDPFGGLFRGDLNLELYWPDDGDKRGRFLSILDKADYLVISSSRQWGSTTRLPERYPLTTTYYRALLGCPAEQSVEQCFNRAPALTGQGQLGFALVHVARSDPGLGPWSINDQPSEEAFTVYDHPQVLLLQKTASYNQERVAALLGSVDLSQVVPVRPAAAGRQPADLLLPPERLAEQRAGGTWSELYDRDSPLNRWPLLAALAWYLTITLLGLLAYPLVRLVLPGLPDRGYGLCRIGALLLVTWMVWLAGSFRLPFTRLTITAAVAILAAVSLSLAWRGRGDLAAEGRRLRRFVLLFELLLLAFFIAGLLIRFANPDLWHPHRGGEKPMELAYLNAVLRSTSFPPYDPWFAGGYLNYYYYGWLLVGVPVRWLGIVPSLAFNLILPTLLALTAGAAFCLGWGLVQSRQGSSRCSLAAGLAAMIGMTVAGNQGTVQMILQGWQRLGAAESAADPGLLSRCLWTLQGLGRALGGADLPFSTGEWYWNPTRIIPDPQVGPITEFPCFSFLFADLHPHLIDLPLTLLVIGWVLSLLLWRPPAGAVGWIRCAAVLLFGGLATGVLRPTNTWSFYPYLTLAATAVAHAAWRIAGGSVRRRLAAATVAVSLLALLAHLLYHPYACWYGPGYTAIEPWRGSHTPLSVYLHHWGLFLLLVSSWLLHETGRWLAATDRARLRSCLPLPTAMGLLTLGLLLATGVEVALVAIPLATWAGVLLLRPDRPDSQRLVLFLIGTAMVITVVVEVVVLRGDVGRMNTVFKLYLQAWTMLAVAGGAAFGWLLPAVAGRSRRALAWWFLLGCVTVGALLYPLVAVPARCRDRMAPEAPRTLEGTTFLEHAVYHDQGTVLHLAEDLQAIRWLQDNVAGSPVIVEGHTPEYRWGSRCSIYTGLPSVIGWNWHQRQQRSLVPPEWVWQRVQAVRDFYTTTDLAAARAFLRRYQVSYIVLGQLERAYYPGPGLAKFGEQEGAAWRTVYHDGLTTIYEVCGDGERMALASQSASARPDREPAAWHPTPAT